MNLTDDLQTAVPRQRCSFCLQRSGTARFRLRQLYQSSIICHVCLILDSVFKAIVLNKILYALPVYCGYLTEGQRHMLQRVLHTASSRGFTPYYYDLDTLAENAHYHLFFGTAAAKLIVSIICTQLNLGHLAPCGWEPVVISLNCRLLNMNSTNETLLFDRFLIMYNLCVFTCIIVMFVFHCTHVRVSVLCCDLKSSPCYLPVSAINTDYTQQKAQQSTLNIKTDYDDRNFITRLLYKDIWLFNSFFPVFFPYFTHCVSCVSTSFLLLNEDDDDDFKFREMPFMTLKWMWIVVPTFSPKVHNSNVTMLQPSRTITYAVANIFNVTLTF